MGGTNDKYIVSSRATSRECDYESNEGRCIVENTKENIEYFHVLPREAMDSDNLMDSLEWSWNLRRGELNLDTCYNILPVSPSVKAKLGSREWMLIPEEETVSELRDAIVAICMGMEYRRHNFPSSPNKIYKYKLVPVLESDESVILRLNYPMDPDNTTAYRYPYSEFPTLYSHVRPEFVIAAAGYNILVGKDAGMAKLSSSIHNLYIMTMTYYHWSKSIDHETNIYVTYSPHIGTSTVESASETQAGREFSLNPDYVKPQVGTNSRHSFMFRRLESGTVDSFSECGTSECYSETVTTPSIQYSKK